MDGKLIDDQKSINVILNETPKKKYASVLHIGCGTGLFTECLSGEKIVGIDTSKSVINKAKRRQHPSLTYSYMSVFDIGNLPIKEFDLVVITDVLYSKYIGNSSNLIYTVVDNVVHDNSMIVSVHLDQACKLRFPYFLLNEYYFGYKTETYRLEVYLK